MDKDFRRSDIGRKRDIVLVTKTADFLNIVERFAAGWIGEEKHHIQLIIADPCAYLLIAALIAGEIEIYRKPCSFGNESAGRIGGTYGMPGEDPAISDTKLYHKFLFSVVCHECYIQNPHILSIWRSLFQTKRYLKAFKP